MNSTNSRGLIASGPHDVADQKPRAVSPRLLTFVWSSVIVAVVVLLWWLDPSEYNIPLCSFHALTGMDCPGCGATRATHELLHGHLAAALRYNALWVVSLPLAVYIVASELRVHFKRRPLPGDLPRRTAFWIAITVAALAFFVIRNWL